MPEFSVPSGCREAMTNLHKAHTERYAKLKGIAGGYADKFNKLKKFTNNLHAAHTKRYDKVVGRMKSNQLESDKVLRSYMDTHATLHQTVKNLITDHEKGSEKLSGGTLKTLKRASGYAQDVHSSLTKGIRSDEKQRATSMSPSGHLERIQKHIDRKEAAIRPVSMGGKVPTEKWHRKQKALHALRAAEAKNKLSS